MKLKKIIIIPSVIILLLLVCITAFLLVHVAKVNAGRKEINALLDRTSYPKLAAVGAVDRLSIIPLVDFYADDADLKNNRLALLNRLRGLFLRVADLSVL